MARVAHVVVAATVELASGTARPAASVAGVVPVDEVQPARTAATRARDPVPAARRHRVPRWWERRGPGLTIGRRDGSG